MRKAFKESRTEVGCMLTVAVLKTLWTAWTPWTPWTAEV